MKVLALVTDAFGGHGGIAQYNRDFLSAVCAAPDVSRTVVLPRLAPEAVGELPPGLTQHAPISNKFSYGTVAAELALDLKPDVIFCGHLYHGWLAAMLAKANGARLVSQLHGTEIWSPLRRSDRKGLQASDLVLTVSRDTFARLRNQIIDAKFTGAVLSNTVHPVFTPGDRAAARARFGLGDGVDALLSVSRLDTREGYKGHDKIIPLLPEMHAAGRNVVYLIAGVGDDRARLEQLVASHNLADHVRFLGKVHFDDLPDLYRAADLFVLPSTGEGFGIVYIEAMACGTPALGLRAGGAPDALCDGDLGWCVEADDLSTAITQALDSSRPDPQALYEAVQARFGRDIFRARVASLLS